VELVLSRTGGAARSRGYKRREREEESWFVSPPSPPRENPPPSREGPGPPFYSCKERVQMYNEGCSNALMCLAEKCLSPMCDGTSQVIRPTYSCPCPTNFRQPCRCP
jgi:hypothetical protein